MTDHNDHTAIVRRVAILGLGGVSMDAVSAVLRGSGYEVITTLPAREPLSAAVLVQPTASDWSVIAQLHLPAVLVTDDEPDGATLIAAVHRGANGIVSAHDDPAMLIRAVELVSIGDSCLTRARTAKLVHALHGVAGERDDLVMTNRELDILQSIDRGESVKQTARALGISPKTVENLQSRLFRKLGVRNRAQAVARAHALGVLTPNRIEEAPPP